MSEYEKAMNQLDPFRNMPSIYENRWGMYPHVLGNVREIRTDREKLEIRREGNNSMIAAYQKENEEIAEALDLLDKHPMLERLRNLLRKLT